MAIAQFKEKAAATRGVDVDSPVAQAAEIAILIGAESFIVDILASTATFIVPGAENPQTFVVGVGQVVSITAGVISVMDRISFYEKYEVQGIY